ncbi:Uncharacterised protein [Yersinia enterocolitica]|nr:Uncharacterised protein [Yersinia enterocolitica]
MALIIYGGVAVDYCNHFGDMAQLTAGPSHLNVELSGTVRLNESLMASV